MCCVFFFKQNAAYEMRISDWSSDVCSSDLGWISLGERKYAPPVLPEDGAIAPLTRRYLSQHQALQYLALDDVENALPFIQDALTLRTDLLPGFRMVAAARLAALDRKDLALALLKIQIGRASCRARVCQYVLISVVAVSLKKNKKI